MMGQGPSLEQEENIRLAADTKPKVFYFILEDIVQTP